MSVVTPSPKEETTFFTDGHISVTNARFMVGKQTYAIRNITSVDKGIKKAPKVWWWILAVILAIIGLGALSGGQEGIIFIVLAVVSGLIAIFIKHKYIVILRTSGSELKALESKEQNFIDTVIDALNEAIIHQG